MQNKFSLLFVLAFFALILACGSDDSEPADAVATSAPTPDIAATISAAVDATVSALPPTSPTVEVASTPTITPTSSPTATPGATPIVVSTPTQVSGPTATPEPPSQVLPCPTAVSPANVSYTPPDIQLDTSNKFEAVLTTSKGVIRVELFGDAAPATVGNFIYLASCGFYDGITFHRVIEDFAAQTGDPTGTGLGGPGYFISDEFAGLSHDKPGTVSMVSNGDDSGGSQFFITQTAAPWLDDLNPIFGQVIEGIEVVDALDNRDPLAASTPGDRLESVSIVQLGSDQPDEVVQPPEDILPCLRPSEPMTPPEYLPLMDRCRSLISHSTMLR